MSFCPACGSEYPDGWKRCPTDEAELLASRNVGKYRVNGLLGAGGMGAVYRAFNPDTRSPVAIKVLHGEASATEASRTRFQREAASIAALTTRHLVNVYDFGSDAGGRMYLVMELLEGHNLRPEIKAAIAKGQGMPVPRINLVLDGSLRGLGAAHKKGIVHRDLKPENIFIADTEDGEVAKVLDFGIAQVQSKESSVITKEGALMGTPAYMAPEQVGGNRGEIGPWTDVYAMGVIAYEMLTGLSPFEDQSVTAIFSRVLTRDFKPLRDIRPDLPQPVLALIDCAMSDHYDNRFADANAFREAWVAAYRGFDPSVAAVPVPPFRRTADTRQIRGGGGGPDAMLATESADATTDPARAATFMSPAQGNTRPSKPSTLTPGGVVTDSAPDKPGGRRGLWLGLGLLALAGIGGAIAMTRRGGGNDHGGGAIHSDAGAIALVSTDAAVPAPLDASSAPPPGMIAIPASRYAVAGFPMTDIEPFFLDATEMTVAGYRDAVKQLGREVDDGVITDGDDSPVRGVTWQEASDACRALGKRLPTEVEWEYAATRAPLDPEGARLLRAGVSGPSPVASHRGDCTPEGLCDLLGNVSEWTADPWRARADSQADGQLRVVRGGSFNVAPASRYAQPESRAKQKADTRDGELGFRCARDRE